jgi:hypothetical protein
MDTAGPAVGNLWVGFSVAGLMRKVALLMAVLLLAAACSGGETIQVDFRGSTVPPAPDAVDGPLDAEVIADLGLVLGDLGNTVDGDAITRLGESGDVRLAWLLSDLLRFSQRGHIADLTIAAFENLTATEVTDPFAWGQVTDWLIAWDLPAPPDYVDWKRLLFELFEPAWARFFDDEDADIDWRWLSWGGVLIDDRPLDGVHNPCARSCIPALDDPAVTDAAGGDWYDDELFVFGVVVEGEARAYPKNIMEVHEMVNDTIGGRRVGIPYCTLCGSAQAYLTDVVPDDFEQLELRTTGLLSRSNKVMFDFKTWSVFDTFTGRALSGPLQDADFTLEMITVRTSTWGDWKAAHPDTTIVAEDGGINRRYSLDPLGGRDDDGPIFPIGDVDPRLPVHEQVLGVIAPDGTVIAFPVAEAGRVLAEDGTMEESGVRVFSDGAGLQAETDGGEPITTHEAFWFAWSQFHPGTEVWTGVDLGG